ncbi:UPF0575 protein C19orf67 homolog isoform X1 [Embiotoca jacksoni]|uniref:UPF0575 protein C19orf67 homolog isoform X1 n=1 Tax=Embiotoca jacksoni TaxID=100190 RepID=UPI0037049DC9
MTCTTSSPPGISRGSAPVSSRMLPEVFWVFFFFFLLTGKAKYRETLWLLRCQVSCTPVSLSLTTWNPPPGAPRSSTPACPSTFPGGVSHFCIGQSQLGCLRMTIFRYCKPTAYLSSVDTGLYKRMRWNVERLRDDQQQPAAAAAGESEAREAVTVGDPDYYFLCYEDVPSAHAEADRDSQRVPYRDVVRMWSIGQWVQVNPDPNTEDIYDWIVCRVPQAKYHSLVFLGSDEPTSCSATYCLQQLLSSNQTAD